MYKQQPSWTEKSRPAEIQHDVYDVVLGVNQYEPEPLAALLRSAKCLVTGGTSQLNACLAQPVLGKIAKYCLPLMWEVVHGIYHYNWLAMSPSQQPAKSAPCLRSDLEDRADLAIAGNELFHQPGFFRFHFRQEIECA